MKFIEIFGIPYFVSRLAISKLIPTFGSGSQLFTILYSLLEILTKSLQSFALHNLESVDFCEILP